MLSLELEVLDVIEAPIEIDWRPLAAAALIDAVILVVIIT